MENNSKEVSLEFNLPDFDRKDIIIRLSNNLLKIKANKKYKNKIQKENFFHSEKSSQSYNYITTLPKINPKKAIIKFNKGILKIKLLKYKS
jgi:HSP20 family molecular chaperone IbpA